MTRRSSGVLVPLVSLRSTRSWGIGEFRDLATFARWLARAGQAIVQILPITEVPGDETSPYSAMTAMALDPVAIALPDVEDFSLAGGEPGMSATETEQLDAVRRSPQIQYREVRVLKDRCLRRAFARFTATEQAGQSTRAGRLADFCAEQAGWLDEYALFQALRTRYQRLPWWQWPAPVARLDPTALDLARQELALELRYRCYVQWIAHEQWVSARRAAAPVAICGDVPFMISADSPDVWARQHEFMLGGSIGVPPDAFSATGQDWGLPPWRWQVMAANDFAWMRRRAVRMAALVDLFRLDHLVGLYRTYIRPIDRSTPAFFSPPDEPTQTWLGERLVTLYRGSGAGVIAEDLGTVPDFVRASLRSLHVPGLKVMRWERRWTDPLHPFIDPADYDEVSVATTGTHDTEPLALWWDDLAEADRHQMLRLPSVRQHLERGRSPLDAIVCGLLDARSQLTILPLQDVFGWRDRINTPAVVNDRNWTWALPWPVDTLDTVAEARDRADWLASATRAARRQPEPGSPDGDLVSVPGR